MASCLTSKPGEERTEEHGADVARDSTVKGHAVAERERERENQLAKRDPGQHVIHEMGGGVVHATAAGRSVQKSAFYPGSFSRAVDLYRSRLRRRLSITFSLALWYLANSRAFSVSAIARAIAWFASRLIFFASVSGLN